jgi:surface carbohydrate biosynthesis protein
MRPVLIPIETASRELLYKVVLSSILAERRIPCYLGSKRAIHTLLNAEKGYVYLDKGFHKGQSETLHARIASREGLVVNLDEEGAVDFPDGSTLRNRYPDELFHSADKVFLWGREQESRIRTEGIQTDKIVVTGHPRFELLKAPYRFLYEADAVRLRGRFGPFILVNTNMGFGNNIRGNAWVRSNYASRFDHLDRIMDFDDQKFDTMIAGIHAIRQITSLPIVVRPHPEENASLYVDSLKDVDNVHVVFEGSVVEWLVACELMIHPDCTTAIEARMLGKKAISCLPSDSPMDLVTQLPLKASSVCNTPDALVKHVGDFLRGNSMHDDASDTFLNDWFAFDQPSMELIAKHISEVCSQGQVKRNSLALATRWKLSKAKIRRKISPHPSDELISNKLKGFTPAKVRDIVREIENGGLLSGESEFAVLDDDLFLFSSGQS